jgi:signal transduction histidine kinase
LPIVLGSAAVALSVALLVGWTLVVLRNLALTREVARNTTLLVAGIVSLATIISVLVLFSVFLVRALLEVRRQYSFIDSVTHELKSPLAELKLCLDTIQRPELRSEQRDQLRQTMLDAVDRLSGFIDDVLEASHLAHGRGGFALQEVELAPLVQRCAEIVATRHKTPLGAVTVEVPEGLTLLTDPTALETVVRNLLDNAIKYSDPPRHVRLSASRRGPGVVQVEVRDNGIGVPRLELGRIFDRFYRVPEEAVRARRGTGLGLFVVSALVRNLGGRIEAHSEGAGRGTTMVVRLPAALKENTLGS